MLLRFGNSLIRDEVIDTIIIKMDTKNPDGEVKLILTEYDDTEHIEVAESFDAAGKRLTEIQRELSKDSQKLSKKEKETLDAIKDTLISIDTEIKANNEKLASTLSGIEDRLKYIDDGITDGLNSIDAQLNFDRVNELLESIRDMIED